MRTSTDYSRQKKNPSHQRDSVGGCVCHARVWTVSIENKESDTGAEKVRIINHWGLCRK